MIGVHMQIRSMAWMLCIVACCTCPRAHYTMYIALWCSHGQKGHQQAPSRHMLVYKWAVQIRGASCSAVSGAPDGRLVVELISRKCHLQGLAVHVLVRCEMHMLLQ